MYGLDLARTDVEAVMTAVVMCAGWCLLGIYQYTYIEVLHLYLSISFLCAQASAATD